MIHMNIFAGKPVFVEVKGKAAKQDDQSYQQPLLLTHMIQWTIELSRLFDHPTVFFGSSPLYCFNTRPLRDWQTDNQ